MDKSVLRGVLLLADALVSLVLAVYSLGFEQLGVPTPGAYLSAAIFPTRSPNSMMEWFIVRTATDWAFWFVGIGALYWFVAKLKRDAARGRNRGGEG
jgi:hypothetical protein